MAASIVNREQPGDADVVLISANYDRTSSFGKGSHRGPAAVLACLDTQIELYDRVSGTTPAGRLGIAHVDPGDLNQLTPEVMVQMLHEEYARHKGRFRVLLGGEHSVSNAAFRAWAEQARDITVVQIDAHADLRDDDSDYNDEPHGAYAHCAVMKRAHDLGFALLQVGIRAYSAEERSLFGHPRIQVFEWGHEEPPVEQLVDAIPTERVYLTVDVDGLDPAHLPATGTPVPGGLSWYYTMDLLRVLTERRSLVAADVVEVCPRAGDVRTEYGAAQLLYSLLGLALCR